MSEAPNEATVSTKLYRHDCGECGYRWSKYDDSDAEYDALKKSIADDAIIERKVLKNRVWRTEGFTIQNTLMKETVRKALESYQDFDPEEDNWTFERPYQPLVHRWGRLQELCDGPAQTPEVKEASHLLMSFLRPILAPSVDALFQTKLTGKVVFNDIWQIFPPGELVATELYGVEIAGRVKKYKKIDAHHGHSSWRIELEYIDWNGECCGYKSMFVNINYYCGTKPVDSFEVAPLVFNKSADKLKKRLIERGRCFEALRGYHFRSYNGTKISLSTSEERLMSGRVVIDIYAYHHSRNKSKPSLRALEFDEKTEANTNTDDEQTEPNHDDSRSESESDDDDGRSCTSSRSSRYTDSEVELKVKKATPSLERREIIDALTDEQCLFATPWVTGFDLKNKEWALFRVADISPINWNDEAFEHLILPGNEKELSWAFVKNKTLANNTFDDFIEDKGRGVIILMFGPPGVGKTFTAEAVAERARVPLYSVSAATLGTDPGEVQEALQRHLDLCKLWNAMLLLDEADIFISARSDNDLARNELVAVFLTKLEYYEGICFMTTNRMSNLDHAIQSRVDLFLRYVNLTVPARRRVWQNFIAKTGQDKFSITDLDLDHLAKFSLNGREIKNLVKTANLLSLSEPDQKIGRERLEMLADNRLQALEAMKK